MVSSVRLVPGDGPDRRGAVHSAADPGSILGRVELRDALNHHNPAVVIRKLFDPARRAG